MNIPKHVHERSPALLTGFALASLLFLTACGTEPPPPPPPPPPIQDERYHVTLTHATNTCNVDALQTAVVLVDIREEGTQLLNFAKQPVSADVSGDELTFSVPIPLSETDVVTLAGTWTFAEDRASFDGETTFEVPRTGADPCLITLATEGAVHEPPELAPPPHTPGPPSSTSQSPITSAAAVADYAHIFNLTGDHGQVAVQFPVGCYAAHETSGRTLLIRGLLANAPGYHLTYAPPIWVAREYRVWRWNGTNDWDLVLDHAETEGVVTKGGTYVVLPHWSEIPPPWNDVPPLSVSLTQEGYYHVAVAFIWSYVGAIGSWQPGGVQGSLWLHFDDPTGYEAFGGSTAGQGAWCHVP